MRVASIVEGIAPAELSGALIEFEDDQPDTFFLVQRETEISLRQVDIEVIRRLDEKNCIIWNSAYLRDKALQLMPPKDFLPTSFEAGPNLENMDDLVESGNEEVSLGQKLSYGAVFFLVTATLMLFIIAISSLGKLSLLDLLRSYGILVCVVSAAFAALMTYTTFFRREKK